jgi:hypothetical protein
VERLALLLAHIPEAGVAYAVAVSTIVEHRQTAAVELR